MKEFEDGLTNLLKDIKFRNRYNSFQNKLSKDIKEIRNGKEILVKGDKSTNFHKMAPTKYNEFLDKAIQKEYKKAPPTVVKNIQSSHSKIVTKLDIEDRVFRTTESQPFITIKDHKENFQNNPTCRLINTSKPEIGKISKQITEKINKIVRQQTNYKQ